MKRPETLTMMRDKTLMRDSGSCYGTDHSPPTANKKYTNLRRTPQKNQTQLEDYLIKYDDN